MVQLFNVRVLSMTAWDHQCTVRGEESDVWTDPHQHHHHPHGPPGQHRTDARLLPGQWLVQTAQSATVQLLARVQLRKHFYRKKGVCVFARQP